jgi:hypothetical protein
VARTREWQLQPPRSEGLLLLETELSASADPLFVSLERRRVLAGAADCHEETAEEKPDGYDGGDEEQERADHSGCIGMLTPRLKRLLRSTSGSPRQCSPQPIGGGWRYIDVTTTTLLYASLGAGLALAAWTIVRFPSLTPRSLAVALAIFLGAQVLMAVGPAIVAAAVTLPYGSYVALLGVILPIFCISFVSCGWLMIVALSLVGGPRGGHRVRVPGHARR